MTKETKPPQSLTTIAPAGGFAPPSPTDHEKKWKARARKLHARIKADPGVTFTAVYEECGYEGRSRTEYAHQVLRARQYSEPLTLEMEAAYDRLTQRETAEVSS